MSEALQVRVAELTDTINTLQEELRQAQRQMVDQSLSPLLADICKEYDLPGIYLYGYTPGFNDGDPCVHSQSTGEYYECEDGEDEHCGVDGEFESNEHQTLAEASNKALGEWRSEKRKMVEDLLSAMEDAFHEAYGTDWFLLWEYEPIGNTVILHRGNYDCGY